jgi:translation initiation factor IF-3
LANKDFAIAKLKDLIKGIMDVAELEQDVKRQGDQFFAILRPKQK